MRYTVLLRSTGRTTGATGASTVGAGRPPAAARSFYNTPRFIFLSWTALVVSAGFGYYFVKSRNTAKAQDFLRKARLEQAQQSAAANGKTVSEVELAQIAHQQSQRKAAANEQSPVQSLAAAFARQKDR